MMPKVLLYIFLLAFSNYLYSVEEANTKDSVEVIYLDSIDSEVGIVQELKYDTTEVDVISIPQSKLDSYIASGDYLYLTEEVREEIGLWDWLKMKFWQWFFEAYNTMGEYGLVELIGFIFGALIIGFIIYKVANRDLSFGFVGSGEERSESELIVSIKKDEFDEMIEKARSNGNRNEVIRLSFLKIISELNLRNLIKYAEDKTNRDYYYEISDNNLKTQFKNVSNIFDYTFYGEFELTDSQLNQYEPLFNNLYNSIQISDNK